MRTSEVLGLPLGSIVHARADKKPWITTLMVAARVTCEGDDRFIVFLDGEYRGMVCDCPEEWEPFVADEQGESDGQ